MTGEHPNEVSIGPELLVTWDDLVDGEEFMLHCTQTAHCLHVEVKRRLDSSICMAIPPEFAGAIAEWFTAAAKRVKGRTGL